MRCWCAGFQYPSDDLSTEDKVTLCVVENYLEFKVGLERGSPPV